MKEKKRKKEYTFSESIPQGVLSATRGRVLDVGHVVGQVRCPTRHASVCVVRASESAELQRHLLGQLKNYTDVRIQVLTHLCGESVECDDVGQVMMLDMHQRVEPKMRSEIEALTISQFNNWETETTKYKDCFVLGHSQSGRDLVVSDTLVPVLSPSLNFFLTFA